MSGANIPDPTDVGRVLAERAMARMKAEGISSVKVATIFAEELSSVAREMVASGIGKHDVADWLESVTAAYRERIRKRIAAPSP